MTPGDDVRLRPVGGVTRERRAELIVASLLAGFCVLVVFFAVGPGSAPLAPTVALVVMTVIATHREAIYPDETALSGSVVVICTCIVGLGDTSLLAPVLCGAAAGLHRDHLRDRHFLKICVNVSATVVPTTLATLVFREFGTAVAIQVVGAAAAVSAYWLLNNAIVGAAVGLPESGTLVRIWGLIRSDLVMLLFGLGGALCGVVMVEVGTWVGLASLAALMVALDVFVISVPGGLVDLRAAWVMLATRGVSGGVAGTAGALVTRGASASVLGACAGLVAGVAAGVCAVATIVAARMFLKYRDVDLRTLAGLLIVESAVPLLAALSAVVAVVAGLEAGLFVASGLVVTASAIVVWRRHRGATRPRELDDDEVMVAVVEAMMDGLPARDR